MKHKIYNARKVMELNDRRNWRRFVKLLYLIFKTLIDMFVPGTSKHQDKLANNGKPRLDRIYSYLTLDLYLESCWAFACWVFDIHGCYTLSEARQYVAEYLRLRINQGRSAWTVRLDAAALAKLYQCSQNDFGVKLPKRCRKDVKRNRISKERLNYYINKYPYVYFFCVSCGPRRKELSLLRPEDIFVDKQGNVIVHVRRGKGGKVRNVIALDDYPLKLRDQAIANGQQYIFGKIPTTVPIHVFRKLFAQRAYQQLARPIDTLSEEECYRCQRDMHGIVYDRKVMRAVSKQLGHRRIDVVTTYLKEAIVDSAADSPTQ